MIDQSAGAASPIRPAPHAESEAGAREHALDAARGAHAGGLRPLISINHLPARPAAAQRASL